MKRLAYIFLISLLAIGGNTKAQFAKPLPPKQNPWAEAQYSVGIIGGLSATRWFHTGGTNTVFDQPITTITTDSLLTKALNNALAGITIQKKLGDYNAIGLDVIYAKRNTILNHKSVAPDAFYHNVTIRDHTSIQYSELLFQIPITQYLTNSSKAIRPYVFIAPRVTIPLQGTITLEKDTLVNASPFFIPHSAETIYPSSQNMTSISDSLSARNMNSWNIGAVVGLGLQFRIPLGGSYYFNTKLDASCHLGLLNSYSRYERGLVEKKDSKGNVILDPNGNPVLDLPIDLSTNNPVDPTRLGKRYISNATVKLTFLFPIKKIQKDACITWGEYD